jgi:TP901 family phage tail tape measure protein
VSVVANVAINVDSRDAVGKLREVSTQAQATQKAFGALQQAAAAFGAGFAISQVIADVKELDTNLRRLGTVGGNVAALDKGLGDLSKQLEGVANKAELAAASYQALSAGFTETSANLKIVETATKAAVGGLVDVTSVVEVTTKTLNAYGLSGEYAIKVTDSISKAIEFGQVQWSDYTSQLGRVASIAALAGVSIDEINAFIAAATKNGATAEVAFTGLGAALATLLQPTEQSKKAAEALGIQWNVTGLQSRGFSGLLEDLSKKQDANKTAVAELLGSQEALRGVLAANSKAGKDYRMILEGLGGATGKTEADFEKMRGSLENTLKSLDTAFKNFSEALGRAFGPTVVVVIRDITGAVDGFAAAFNAVPQPVLKATAEVVKAVAQLLLLKKAIEGIIALRVALIGMFAATATGAGAAAVASSGLTMNMRYLQGSMATATTQGTALAGVLRSIAAFGVITVGINLIVTGLQEAMTAAAEVRKRSGCDLWRQCNS